MKRTISLIIVFALCLSLCACAGKKAIKLTLDNYEQYLKVSSRALIAKDYEGNSFVIGRATYDFVTNDYGQNIYGYISVEGLSQNFNYSNIKVEVEITGKCYHCDLKAEKDENEKTLKWSDFSFVATCNKVDITGKGDNGGSDKFVLPTGRGVPFLSYANGVTRYYKDSDFLNYTYKVISVSGTVTPI